MEHRQIQLAGFGLRLLPRLRGVEFVGARNQEEERHLQSCPSEERQPLPREPLPAVVEQPLLLAVGLEDLPY